QRAMGRVDFQALGAHLASPLLVVTDGEAGAIVVDRRGSAHVPARPVAEPVDICGAGDSFMAGAALALCVIGDPIEAGRVGPGVVSITMMKGGTGTATPEEVRFHLNS